MRVSSNIAFKEWAVVVDALGQGEQTIILRKGGIREQRGEFQVDHQQFWLFPTQFHEAEGSIIPSKRPALRVIAEATRPDSVDLQYFAVADPIIQITDPALLGRLQGRHVWTENVVQQRFDFGRERGLHALVVRIYRLPEPVNIALLAAYGGCKSWIQLDAPVSGTVTPVLDDLSFERQRDEVCELIDEHACAHP
jgi:hypothetical protein